MPEVQILKPRIDAGLAMESANTEERTVEFQFYSGAEVRRYSWLRGEYTLRFSMDPAHVRLNTLNSGRAPVLETHSDYSTQDVLGVIENGRLEGGKGMARVRFAKGDEAADRVWNKIEQKILRNVSMGVAIHKMKELSKEEDKIKSYLAVDWEPLEISVVPIGADPNAQIVMSGETADTLSVETELAVRADRPKEAAMPETTTTGTEARTETNTAPVNADAILAAERARTSGLNAIHAQFTRMGGTNLNLTEAIERGTSVEEFRRLAFEALAQRSEQNPTRAHHTELTADERDKWRPAAGEQIAHLMSGKAVDAQNPFRGMSVLRLAEEVLAKAGKRAHAPAEVATLSMHATADFPLILADSARKAMLAAYQAATPTYRIWTKPSTTPDFKTMSRLRLGETPAFLKVPEGAQITLGTMTESREQYALATYGRGASFTRQMLINDDLGAFNDLQVAFGVQAARLENKTVYAILTANANMSDSTALFHNNHGNLGSGALGNTAFDAMFAAFGVQKGLDAATVLNLTPKFVIVPVAKQGAGQAALTATGNNLKASDQNLYAGRLTLVADAELDGSSTSVWYAACDPGMSPGIEYAHLAGAEGPQSIRRENEDAILGVQIYNFLDFGAKAVDWRTLYKSTGV